MSLSALGQQVMLYMGAFKCKEARKTTKDSLTSLKISLRRLGQYNIPYTGDSSDPKMCPSLGDIP